MDAKDLRSGPCAKVGISMPKSLLAAARERAEKQHRGKLSRYVQALLEADLAEGEDK